RERGGNEGNEIPGLRGPRGRADYWLELDGVRAELLGSAAGRCAEDGGEGPEEDRQDLPAQAARPKGEHGAGDQRQGDHHRRGGRAGTGRRQPGRPVPGYV